MSDVMLGIAVGGALVALAVWLLVLAGWEALQIALRSWRDRSAVVVPTTWEEVAWQRCPACGHKVMPTYNGWSAPEPFCDRSAVGSAVGPPDDSAR